MYKEDIAQIYRKRVKENIYSLNIILFGSYRPDTNLVKLNKALIKKGFINIKLCRDNIPELGDNDEFDDLERSEYCLQTSHLNILVFFLNIDNSGVSKEADYIFLNHPELLPKTIFFEERDEKKKWGGMSQLIRDELNRFNIIAGTFFSKKGASSVVEGHIKNRAKSLFSKRLFI